MGSSAWAARYRQKALERAERMRARYGDDAYRRPSEKGDRLPNLARAHQIEEYFRCRLAVPMETGQANQQAVAKVACSSLVFGKALHQHLVDVHGLEVAVDQVREYFDQVAPHQGGDE